MHKTTIMKLLTIVMPTYNMEKYLRRSLDSLIIEDKDLFDTLEVLVINDGSKDSSSIIAREYEKMYSGVFRVIDKENGNYGSCVNRGLKEASGRYIKVLDADDSFNTQVLSQYLLFLRDVDVDLVLTDYVLVNEDNKIFAHCRYDKVLKGKTYLFNELDKSVYDKMAMHGVTYRTENLRKINYHQTEGISYTDQEWIFKPITTVNKVVRFDKYLYRYLIGREGQTMQAKVRLKSISQENSVLRSLIGAYSELSNFEECHREYLHRRLFIRLIDTYSVCIATSDDSVHGLLEETDKYLLQTNPQLYEESNNYKLPGLLGSKFIMNWRLTGNGIPWVYRIDWTITKKIKSLSARLSK